MSKPHYWEQACAELSAADPVMQRLIARYPDMYLVSRGDAFVTLARSIVGQQISVKAASSVWAKFEAFLGQVTPAVLLQKTSTQLRSCGLSERKVLYLQDLARFALEGRLAPASWHDIDEMLVIEELVSIKGIGRWTAEMFLIFYLQRPDVYPVADIGLQKAIGLHYYDNSKPSLAELHQQGEKWQPWRTVATWYLWRSIDPEPVAY